MSSMPPQASPVRVATRDGRLAGDKAMSPESLRTAREADIACNDQPRRRMHPRARHWDLLTLRDSKLVTIRRSQVAVRWISNQSHDTVRA